MLKGHNELRALHHAPATILDRTLSKYAQDWANRLAASGEFIHSRGPYGENLAYFASSSAIDAVEAGAGAIEGWGGESAKYRYGSDFSSVTGHFTQMVWVSSSRLGCGFARGFARGPQGSLNAVYIVCSYDPPGNVTGQFRENVLR
jgi:uncharacterized protein YkwD